ncbi:ABC transporter substrate-binding protein [Parafrankia sp. FMc2]|uniref:ABC transporter substrate-binding protein n=1 Tax=Parafrankia sp. FMc2 TaxID=3233196 RepID=UPI0034D742FB
MPVAAVLVAGGATACGSDSDSGSTGPLAATGDSSTLSAPVTVEHTYGTTTIESIPKRIVTLDLQWTDVLLAMGVEPVGYTVDPSMPATGVPWEEVSASAEKIEATDGLPIEKILALEPDLIVAAYAVNSEETYRLLSASVPVIAGPPGGQVPAWQDLTRTAGKFLNQTEKAKEVIAEAEAPVTALAAELPELRGKTFALAQYIVGDSLYIVGDPNDGSSKFFQAFGMELYPPVIEESQRAGQVRVKVSVERADLLRADLLGFLVNGGDESALADIPGFDQLPGAVATLDYATIVGLNTPSPLSIQYSLDKFRPYLTEAAGKA